jgi:hypothetical protein
MPTDIKLKNSVTATNAPTSLQQGEVAINITDKKVWVGNAATTPVLLLGSGADGTFTNLTVSGVASFADGTVSAPSITNIGDTNTGIFFPAADTIAFAEGGVESMRIDANGRVGIGTTNPAQNFVVSNAGAQGIEVIPWDAGSGFGYIQAYNRSTSAGSPLALLGSDMRLWTSGSERMRIDSSGNVSIGTTNSTNKQTIQVSNTSTSANSESGLSIFNSARGNNYQATVKFGSYESNNTTRWTAGEIGAAFTGYIDGANSGALLFSTSNAGTVAERMRITSAGNVGIGNSNPTYTFEVGSGVGDTRGFFRPNNAFAIGVVNGANLGGYIGANGADNMVFCNSSGTERMRIDSNSNLLVGTTLGGAGIGFDARLAVSSGGETAIIRSNAGGDAFCLRAWNTGTSGNNLFIGFGTEASYTGRGSITYNRGAGVVAYNVTSDYRAKDIISPVLNSGEIIDSVPVYMGKMKGATQARPMFIAHETPDYAHTGEKDAVDKDGNPVYQQMDASSLVPVLWAEIQSLRKRVAQLESK